MRPISLSDRSGHKPDVQECAAATDKDDMNLSVPAIALVAMALLTGCQEGDATTATTATTAPVPEVASPTALARSEGPTIYEQAGELMKTACIGYTEWHALDPNGSPSYVPSLTKVLDPRPDGRIGNLAAQAASLDPRWRPLATRMGLIWVNAKSWTRMSTDDRMMSGVGLQIIRDEQWVLTECSKSFAV